MIDPDGHAAASSHACGRSEARAYWLESLTAGVRFMATADGHPLAECLESLVSIPAAAAAAGVPIDCLDSPHPVGRARDHRIRRANVEPLLAVAGDLHSQGLTLVIEDALRSSQTQRDAASSATVLRAYGEVLAWIDPQASDRQIIERLGVICAATPITAGHTAGAAVDVSVRRADGSDLDRGGVYLDFTERMPMASPFVDAEQAHVRELITAAMAKQGFVAFPFEFWHYSRGDVLAAVASGSSEPARFGPVDVAPDGSVSPVRDVHAPLGEPAAIVSAVRAAIHEARGR